MNPRKREETTAVFTHPEGAFQDGEVGFDPVVYRVDGTFDPAALVAALRAQPALADFTDELGNAQSSVRIDPTSDGRGYWVAVPEGTAQKVVDQAVAAYKPPAVAAPLPEVRDVATQLKATVAKAKTVDDVKAALSSTLDLLTRAAGGPAA